MTRDTAKQMIKSLSSMEDWADGFCFGSTPSTSQLSFSLLEQLTCVLFSPDSKSIAHDLNW